MSQSIQKQIQGKDLSFNKTMSTLQKTKKYLQIEIFKYCKFDIFS